MLELPGPASTWAWVRNRVRVRSAPETSAPRRSAPVTSARVRSAPRRSAPVSRAPRRLAPTSGVLRRSRPIGPRRRDPARSSLPASRLAWRSSGLTACRWVSTSYDASVATSWPVTATVSTTADSRSDERPDRCWQAQREVEVPEQLVELAHHREHGEHLRADDAPDRQSFPPKVTWVTCWPAPKQSNTVQPR